MPSINLIVECCNKTPQLSSMNFMTYNSLRISFYKTRSLHGPEHREIDGKHENESKWYVLTGPLPAISTAPRLFRKPCSPHTQPAVNKNIGIFDQFSSCTLWACCICFSRFVQFLTRYAVDDRVQERKYTVRFEIASETHWNWAHRSLFGFSMVAQRKTSKCCDGHINSAKCVTRNSNFMKNKLCIPLCDLPCYHSLCSTYVMCFWAAWIE